MSSLRSVLNDIVKCNELSSSDPPEANKMMESHRERFRKMLIANKHQGFILRRYPDQNERIELYVSLSLIGNLTVGNFFIYKHSEVFIDACADDSNLVNDWAFWQIESAAHMFYQDRPPLVDAKLNEINVKRITNKTVLACYYKLRGYVESRRENYDMAISFLNEGLEALDATINAPGCVYYSSCLLLSLATCHRKLGDAATAMEYCARALANVPKGQKDGWDVSKVVNIMGEIKMQTAIATGDDKLMMEAVSLFNHALEHDSHFFLKKYDSFAHVLTNRCLGLFHLHLCDYAVLDARAADVSRRLNLGPSCYKSVTAPLLLARMLNFKAKVEYEERGRTIEAANSLWEAIMYFNVSIHTLKCGGFYPLSDYTQIYNEMKSDHMWAMQQMDDDGEMPRQIKEALTFYRNLEAGRYDQMHAEDRTQEKTVTDSEFIDMNKIMKAAKGKRGFFRLDDTAVALEKRKSPSVDFEMTDKEVRDEMKNYWTDSRMKFPFIKEGPPHEDHNVTYQPEVIEYTIFTQDDLIACAYKK